MTSTQPIDESSDRFWFELPERIGSRDDFGTRPWELVKDIEFLPGVAVGASRYVLPKGWTPAGHGSRDSSRTLELQGDGGMLLAETRLGQSLRRCLVAFALPQRTINGMRTSKPSTWIGRARIILRMVRWVSANKANPETLWSHLDELDWHRLSQSVGKAASSRKKLGAIIRLMQELGRRGLLEDFPQVASDELSASEIGPIEGSLKNRTAATKPDRSDPTYLPLNDEFVSDFIGKAIWFQDNLADQLIDCWANLRRIKSDLVANEVHHEKITAERRAYIASYDWRDRSGASLTELPWPISVLQNGRPHTSSAWPPQDVHGIEMCISSMQAMNFCVLAFCTGARHSELLSAHTSSLDVDERRLVALTYKLARELSGVERDWPLHPVAMRAMEIQMALAQVIRPDGEDHLWVTFRPSSVAPGSAIPSMNEPLIGSLRLFGSSTTPDGIRFHPHRWRHTIGRLVALSISSAPHVLQDLFGHRNVEMTLRYMLSDPEIASDAIRVAKEAAMTMVEAAIEEVDHGLASGPAAQQLGKGLAELGMTKGEDGYGATDLRELAEILTVHGRYWQIVRPGVICTKTLGEFGPCTRGRGTPDPGSCSTGCDHRLETERARTECERLLGFLLSEHAAAETAGAEMLAANLEGQILANLKRWEDVRLRATASNETALRIWESAKQ